MKTMLRSLFVLAALLLSSVAADAATRFATCATTCTWDGSSTAMWGAASGGTGASVPGSGDAVILDTATCVGGTTCTITVNTTVTVQSISMGTCTASTAGCILNFATNNNNVTLSLSFDGSGTGVRTLSMGNGLWTVQGFNNNTWNYTVTSNLTHNSNGSTLSFIPSSPTPTGAVSFISGGRSYNVVTHSGVTNQAILAISGSPTIATLTLTAPFDVTFANSSTTTITNAFTWTGSSSNQNFVGSDSTNATSTIAAAAGSTISWTAIRGIVVTGNAVTATNSFDLRSNTLITITPPSTGGGGRIIGG